MGEILNLRLARKARDRKAREAQAEANRALHGRTKAQRRNETVEKARREAALDGARRED